jgi:hypothetical protein
MQPINKIVKQLLKEHSINEDLGILALLGIYYNLDIDTCIPDDVIQAINQTKILDKDYANNNSINWQIPLFEGGQADNWEWVAEFVNQFGKINPERRGILKDAITRMKRFFAENPEYRKEDVIQATKNYFRSVRDPQYLMKSHKFIFDGAGVMKKSELLGWCEKLKLQTSNTNNSVKGKVV